MDRDRAEPEQGAHCTGCGRELECCCFCDDPNCGVPICYPCLMIDLRQAMAQPHAHGG